MQLVLPSFGTPDSIARSKGRKRSSAARREASGVLYVIKDRLGIPGIEHANHSVVPSFDVDRLAHAVFAAEQLRVEFAADDGHHAERCLSSSALQALPYLTRRFDQGEELAVDGVSADVERMPALLRRHYRRPDDVHRRLQLSRGGSRIKGHGIDVGKRVDRFVVAVPLGARPPGIDLRNEQARRLPGDGVSRHGPENRIRRHRCGDAETDREHHQDSEAAAAPSCCAWPVQGNSPACSFPSFPALMWFHPCLPQRTRAHPPACSASDVPERARLEICGEAVS